MFRFYVTNSKKISLIYQSQKRVLWISEVEGTELSICLALVKRSKACCLVFIWELTSHYQAFFTKKQTNKQAIITTTKKPSKQKIWKNSLGKMKSFSLYYCHHKGKIIYDRNLATRRPDKCKFQFCIPWFASCLRYQQGDTAKRKKPKTPVLRVLPTQCLFCLD